MNDKPLIPLNYRAKDPRRQAGWLFWVIFITAMLVAVQFIPVRQGRRNLPTKPSGINEQPISTQPASQSGGGN